MQINGLNGVSAYNPYTQKSSANAVKNIPLPSYGWGFGLIATKTETNRSDEEIKNAMLELAKQDARKGIYGMDLDKTHTKTRQSKEFADLVGEYTQSVSPDRKSIFPAGIAQMGKAIKLKGTKPLIDDSLMQLMLNGAKINLKNAGVMYDAKNKMMEINHVEFFIGGENIGFYDMGRGWGFQPTEAEQSRYGEMNRLYYEVWTAETRKIEMENK